MSVLDELGRALHVRRQEMGLTQETLARLSGLSRTTVVQMERGRLRDLSLQRASRLASAVGLSVQVAGLPAATRRSGGGAERNALAIAAKSASVSFREQITAMQLRRVLVSGNCPTPLQPHVLTFLDEAPVSLLADVVEQIHRAERLPREQVWKTMRDLAAHLQASRELWQ